MEINNSTWSIDPTHSEVQFKIKHLVITTVTGSFVDFNGELKLGDNGVSSAQASFSANIASINTNNADRDGHLKSADFFDAEQFPTLSFEAKQFVDKGSDDYEIIGDLTIKGNTKEVKLKSELGGVVVDGYGQTKIGFEVNGKISRADFGLTWSPTTEAGGVIVSDEVKLIANLQFVKQA